MKLILIPQKNFDTKSKETIKILIGIAKKLLSKWGISCPRSIEFYDEFHAFTERILPQAQSYGLTKNQSIEFIKASLNLRSYGTFNITDNSIIEMNFHPACNFFYPSIDFFNLLVHESLHLFLYSNLKRNIYNDKFKFKNGQYIGKEKIIQLDEGFAGFLTDKILENFDFNAIKELPIYSGLNKAPSYEKEVEGINLDKFNQQFDELYESNSKKGYELIKNKFNQIDGPLKEKIKKIISFISKEIEILYEHK